MRATGCSRSNRGANWRRGLAAEFVVPDSSKHIVVPGDRAWATMIGAIERFVGDR